MRALICGVFFFDPDLPRFLGKVDGPLFCFRAGAFETYFPHLSRVVAPRDFFSGNSSLSQPFFAWGFQEERTPFVENSGLSK